MPDTRSAYHTAPKQSWPLSAFKNLAASEVVGLDQPMVITASNKPIAVLVPYELYLEWQKVQDNG